MITLIVGRMGWLDTRFIRVGLGCLMGLPLVRLGLRRASSRRAIQTLTRRGSLLRQSGAHRRCRGDPLAWLFGLLIAPFVVVTLLGSMLPATDFDVLDTTSKSRRSITRPGRIQFLPHNVYSNMPFDVEMLHLLGMSVMGDWWWGALSGHSWSPSSDPRRP